jgi:hypothetical protein
VTAPADIDPVEQVLAQYELAQKRGAPKPGRGKLADATGLSPHYVRQAIDKIKAAGAAGAPGTTRQQPSANSAQPVGDRQSTRSTAQRAPIEAGEATRSPATRADSPGDLTPAPATQADVVCRSISAHGGRQRHTGAGDGQPAPDRSGGEVDSPTRPPVAPATSLAELAPGRTSMQPTGKTAHQRTSSALENQPCEPGPSPGGGTRAGGIMVSWLGFAFGSVTSIAANVLHTWLPSGTQPPGWAPGLGPMPVV